VTLLERSGAVFVEAVTGKDTSVTFKDVRAFIEDFFAFVFELSPQQLESVPAGAYDKLAGNGRLAGLLGVPRLSAI
jgi:hypothetical protein